MIQPKHLKMLLQTSLSIKFYKKIIFLDLNVQPGRSESQEIQQILVDVCLKRAIELMKKEGNWLNQDLENIVDEFVKGIIDDENVINYIRSILLSEKKTFNSTSSLRNNTTSGYTSIKRMASGSFH